MSRCLLDAISSVPTASVASALPSTERIDIRVLVVGALHTTDTAGPETRTAPAASCDCILCGGTDPSLIALQKEDARLAFKVVSLAPDSVDKSGLTRSRLELRQCSDPRHSGGQVSPIPLMMSPSRLDRRATIPVGPTTISPRKIIVYRRKSAGAAQTSDEDLVGYDRPSS